jgi:hypothetical protein
MRAILATLDNWMTAEEISERTGLTKAVVSQTIKWRSNGRVEMREEESEYERSRVFRRRVYRRTRQTTLLEAGTKQKQIDAARSLIGCTQAEE